MGRRAWAWGVPVVVGVLLALAGLYATTTPRYALYRLGAAMQRHDVATAERYFDPERIADRATDVIVADYFSRQPEPVTAAEVNGRQLAASIARRRIRPQVLTRVRTEVHRSIERAGIQAVPVALPVGLLAVFRAFEISRQGPDAWVAFQDPVQGAIRFRMSRQPDRSWRISEFDPEWVRRRAQEAPTRVR
ncbi:MAG: hypothetical protein ACREJS_12440 [Candidatus Rokuibacteriota bacterium]